jgi:hypothetical protein
MAGGPIRPFYNFFFATKAHKGTQRKKEYPNHTNEKLLEVQKGAGSPGLLKKF